MTLRKGDQTVILDLEQRGQYGEWVVHVCQFTQGEPGQQSSEHVFPNTPTDSAYWSSRYFRQGAKIAYEKMGFQHDFTSP